MSPRPPLPNCVPVAAAEAQAWLALLAVAHQGLGSEQLPDHPTCHLFAPLLAPAMHRPRVWAHLAQSLDGRTALPDGSSFWITGAQDVRHTHRLRAVADAVIVGAETAVRDDPALTVREVPGPNPLRVVLDPRGRVPESARICQDGSPTLLLRTGGPGRVGTADVVMLPTAPFAPADILGMLEARGVRRVLVEGGGVTVSRFLQAGCLDRLHLVVAPVLLGVGRPTLHLQLGDRPAACPRPVASVVPMGQDVLYDLDFTDVYVPGGAA